MPRLTMGGSVESTCEGTLNVGLPEGRQDKKWAEARFTKASGSRATPGLPKAARVPPAHAGTPCCSLRGQGHRSKSLFADGIGRPEAVPLDVPSRVAGFVEVQQCRPCVVRCRRNRAVGALAGRCGRCSAPRSTCCGSAAPWARWKDSGPRVSSAPSATRSARSKAPSAPGRGAGHCSPIEDSRRDDPVTIASGRIRPSAAECRSRAESGCTTLYAHLSAPPSKRT